MLGFSNYNYKHFSRDILREVARAPFTGQSREIALQISRAPPWMEKPCA